MAQKEEKRKEGTKETGKMTMEEAGRKGGETTKETHGREFYQEIGKKGGQTSGKESSSGREETSERGGTSEKRKSSERGEVVVKRSGKDIDVTFSSEQEAQDWESSIRPMLEEGGYHFTREKPAAEAAEAAAGE